MKQCPKCNEVYFDTTLNYCLSDGTVLSDSFNNAETVLMSGDSVTNRSPSTTQSSVRFNAITKPTFTYSTIALLLMVVGGGVFWYMVGNKFVAAPTMPLAETNTSESTNQLTKSADVSNSWTFLTETAGGEIKVSSLRQDRTLKLKFTNGNSATTQIKYRMRAECKMNGKWNFIPWLDATVTVKGKQEQLDNFPIFPVAEDVRKVEVEIIDWNYVFD